LVIGLSVEHATQRSSAFGTGPAVLPAFQLADPPGVHVVARKMPARIELMQDSVDSIG
jgi:hypothetical protein